MGLSRNFSASVLDTVYFGKARNHIFPKGYSPWSVEHFLNDIIGNGPAERIFFMKELRRGLLSSIGGEVLKGEKTLLHASQEVAAMAVVFFYLGIDGSPREVQDFFRTKMAPSIIRGERRRMSQDAPFLLKDYEIVDETKSKIPQAGRPLLIIGNHWDTGPLHGRWPSYEISKAVVNIRGDGEKNEIRWLMQDSLELTVPLANLKTGKVMPATEYILDKIIKSYNFFKVTAPFKVERNMNNHETDNVVRGMLRAYSEGVPIGLYPEAQGTIVLQDGNWRSGFLAVALARKNHEGLVLPVGQWNEGCKLHLNFGDPFPISEIAKFRGKEGYQEVANLMMKRVSFLVPEKYRGAYKTS